MKKQPHTYGGYYLRKKWLREIRRIYADCACELHKGLLIRKHPYLFIHRRRINRSPLALVWVETVAPF